MGQYSQIGQGIAQGFGMGRRRSQEKELFELLKNKQGGSDALMPAANSIGPAPPDFSGFLQGPSSLMGAAGAMGPASPPGGGWSGGLNPMADPTASGMGMDMGMNPMRKRFQARNLGQAAGMNMGMRPTPWWMG